MRAVELDLFRLPISEQEARFIEFHKANPHIYREIVRRVSALTRAGVSRVGIAMVFEVMRYDHLISTQGEPWKLNNTYRAYYVRLLMKEHPHLAGLIETRRSRADEMKAA